MYLIEIAEKYVVILGLPIVRGTLKEGGDVVDVNVFVTRTGIDVALRAGAVAGGEAVIQFDQVVEVNAAVLVEVGGGAIINRG